MENPCCISRKLPTNLNSGKGKLHFSSSWHVHFVWLLLWFCFEPLLSCFDVIPPNVPTCFRILIRTKHIEIGSGFWGLKKKKLQFFKIKLFLVSVWMFLHMKWNHFWIIFNSSVCFIHENSVRDAPCAWPTTTKRIHYVSCPCVDTRFMQPASASGCSSNPRVQCAECLSVSSLRGSGSCSRCSAKPCGLSTVCSRWMHTTVIAWRMGIGRRQDPTTVRSWTPAARVGCSI